AGLYGWKDYLYVLTREPREDGGTRWSLHRIDPRADKLGRTVVLPTRSAHVVLAPGPRYWAVVEKGSVEADGGQTLDGLLLVPSSWIEKAPSPLVAGREDEVSCEEAGKS
ncbi:MAG: hypothetical protein D6692_11605, partial [Planctomycetota bacterium]